MSEEKRIHKIMREKDFFKKRLTLDWISLDVPIQIPSLTFFDITIKIIPLRTPFSVEIG
jgi:hypothetical protein